MATLLASAPASVHRYPARRLHFYAKGVEPLIERQAEQPRILSWRPCCPSEGFSPFFSGLGCAQQNGHMESTNMHTFSVL